MALDPGIFNQFQRAPKSVQDLDREARVAESQGLELLMQREQMGDRQRARAQQQRLMQTLQGLPATATDDDRVSALRGIGEFGQADNILKGGLERQKATAEAAEREAKTAEEKRKTASAQRQQQIQFVMSFGTPQEAIASLNQANDIPMNERAAIIRSVPNDPAGFREWQLRLVSGLGTPEQQFKALAPNVQTRNTGGTTDTLAIDPLTGRPQVTGSVRNTQSPDSVASNAVQIRGQNLTDARARETADQSLTRPFEVTGPEGMPILVQQDKQGNLRRVEGFGPKDGASKPLTEGQAKANLFGTRSQEADAILARLSEKGVERPGAIKGFAEATGNIIGLGTDALGGALSDVAGKATNWTQSDEQQQVDQAQRDFINAVLRRESGAVINPGEFRNAEQQYFPQPGDSQAVKSQKARNRQTAIQGILAEVPSASRLTPQPPKPGPTLPMPANPNAGAMDVLSAADAILGIK